MMTRYSYEVRIEIDKDGEGHAYISSAAGPIGTVKIEVARSDERIIGYSNLGSTILNDVLETEIKAFCQSIV